MASWYPSRCGNPMGKDGTCCCSYCEGYADAREYLEEIENLHQAVGPDLLDACQFTLNMEREMRALALEETARADKAEARHKECAEENFGLLLMLQDELGVTADAIRATARSRIRAHLEGE